MTSNLQPKTMTIMISQFLWIRNLGMAKLILCHEDFIKLQLKNHLGLRSHLMLSWGRDISRLSYVLAALSSLPRETSLHALAFSKPARGNECPYETDIMYFNHIHVIMYILSVHYFLIVTKQVPSTLNSREHTRSWISGSEDYRDHPRVGLPQKTWICLLSGRQWPE